MTFLPILERELRSRARSRANYWARFGVGLVGLLIGVPPLVWSAPVSSPASIGHGVFIGIVGAAFLFCCTCCLLTADSVSAERREGTLGLLLLTRVKHFDVLLGKFASNGMTCLFALVACLPVLAIPVLAGGVTGGEVFRKGLVLLSTLFLALSTGLWASTRGEERFRTGGRAVLVVALLVLAPGLFGLVAPWTYLSLGSPLGALAEAGDSSYKLAPTRFWISLGMVQGAGAGMLLAAILGLRSRLRSEGNGGSDPFAAAAPSPAQPAARELPRHDPTVWPYVAVTPPQELDAPAPHPARRATPLRSSREPTALHWLLRRQRGTRAMLWGAALLTFLYHLLFLRVGLLARFWSPAVYQGASWSMSLIISVITGALVAWAASRFFIEARRQGELELLLTSPLGAEAIVSAQWDVLKRLLRWPVIVMLLPSLLQGLSFLALRNYYPSDPAWIYFYFASLVLGAINCILGMGALCWLGLWFGFRSASQARAVLLATGLARGFPYVFAIACWMATAVLISGVFRRVGGSTVQWLASLVPQVVTAAFCIGLMLLARQQLMRGLKGAPPLSTRQVLSALVSNGLSAIRRARSWRPQ